MLLPQTPMIEEESFADLEIWCNRAITATVTSHTPEPAEKCPRGTIWGTTHPEVLPDPDIRVEDTETVEEGELERKGSLEPEEEKGAEPKEKGCEESEERRGNSATLRNLEGDLGTPQRPIGDTKGAATSLERCG
ncbi:hypothetical protein NDU88_009462 [Pleurodeles waltl]|uniref:Uncharacterized protein n=1 Tax=Pleurodeles waltl TaxID=8319 RepID=A0AAV7QRL0_PLEWA|nr:hypothetical protein NDU88_009462 [Pleurodeles waltl]